MSWFEFQSFHAVGNLICMCQNNAVHPGQRQYELSTNQPYTQYMTQINVFILLNPGSIRTYAMAGADSPLMGRFRAEQSRMPNAQRGWLLTRRLTPVAHYTAIYLQLSIGILLTHGHTHTHSAWGCYSSPHVECLVALLCSGCGVQCRVHLHT